MHDYYVAFAVRATGAEEQPVPECEVTEVAWAIVEAASGRVAEQRAVTVAPTARPAARGDPAAVSLDRALAAADQSLDALGASFVLVCDGPFALRRALKLECAAKGIHLPPHWGVYFDLRKEAMRLHTGCAAQLTSLPAVLRAFELDLPLASCLDTALAISTVLDCMIGEGHAPNHRPQQIPHGDAVQLERQWRASPVSRDHIQHQQQQAQQKAAQVIGFGDESGGQRVCVRMRGLPFQATPADVVRFFDGLVIAEPDGIQFLYNLQGKSKGEAFVQFVSEAEAVGAAQRDKQFMGERYVEVFPATLQDMRYCLAQSNPSTAGSTIVRCRGMPYTATADEVAAFFEGCAVVPGGVSLCLGGDSRPTGEAFVQFATEDDTSRALRRHRCHLGGRYVEIFRSSKQEMVNQCQQRLRALGHKRGAARPTTPSQFSPHCARLRGLPFSLNEMDIAALFAGLRICRHGIHMVYSAEEKPTGEAFVEFDGPDDVDRAVAKHKSPMGHRYVEVFRSSAEEIMLACGGGDHDPLFAEPPQIEQPPQPLLLQAPPGACAAARGDGALIQCHAQSVQPDPLLPAAATTTVRRVIRVTAAAPLSAQGCMPQMLIEAPPAAQQPLYVTTQPQPQQLQYQYIECPQQGGSMIASGFAEPAPLQFAAAGPPPQQVAALEYVPQQLDPAAQQPTLIYTQPAQEMGGTLPVMVGPAASPPCDWYM